MSHAEIYISAYPRSGTTWLARMLDSILEPSYIVRRGHFVLMGDKLCKGRFYTVDGTPKQLAQEDDASIVLLVRDPRDICVSGAWLWQQPVEAFLDRMVQGNVARCGRWDEYNYQHIDRYIMARYEDLLSSPFLELSHLVGHTGVSNEKIKKAIECNSFANYKVQIGDDKKKLREKGLRKGIAGDWRNHFTSQMNNRMWNEFGWMMKRLGYKNDTDLHSNQR